MTDINYAFFDLKPDSQSQQLVPTSADPWADHDKRFTGPDEGVTPPDSWAEDSTGPWGNFGQILKLKVRDKEQWGDRRRRVAYSAGRINRTWEFVSTSA